MHDTWILPHSATASYWAPTVCQPLEPAFPHAFSIKPTSVLQIIHMTILSILQVKMMKLRKWGCHIGRKSWMGFKPRSCDSESSIFLHWIRGFFKIHFSLPLRDGFPCPHSCYGLFSFRAQNYPVKISDRALLCSPSSSGPLVTQSKNKALTMASYPHAIWSSAPTPTSISLTSPVSPTILPVHATLVILGMVLPRSLCTGCFHSLEHSSLRYSHSSFLCHSCLLKYPLTAWFKITNHWPRSLFCLFLSLSGLSPSNVLQILLIHWNQ